MSRLVERFQRRQVLLDAIAQQKIVNGDHAAAKALADSGELVHFAEGETLISQGDDSDDAFFLLHGAVEIWIFGKLIPYQRRSGEVVGEFAAINPDLKRTATIVAASEVVALRVSSEALVEAAKNAAGIWRMMAIDLTRKVEQRNQFINATNNRPRIVLIATAEHDQVAEQLDLSLSADFDVTWWKECDLEPGTYELERLHRDLATADFAIILAHPAELWRARRQTERQGGESILFELGYALAQLGRHRAILLVPEAACENALPEPFKGLRPWCFPDIDGNKPPKSALGDLVRRLTDYIITRKVRARLTPEN